MKPLKLKLYFQKVYPQIKDKVKIALNTIEKLW